MKNLTNLKGAKMLSKNEQKTVNGGKIVPACEQVYCLWRCVFGQCVGRDLT